MPWSNSNVTCFRGCCPNRLRSRMAGHDDLQSRGITSHGAKPRPRRRRHHPAMATMATTAPETVAPLRPPRRRPRRSCPPPPTIAPPPAPRVPEHGPPTTRHAFAPGGAERAMRRTPWNSRRPDASSPPQPDQPGGPITMQPSDLGRRCAASSNQSTVFSDAGFAGRHGRCSSPAASAPGDMPWCCAAWSTARDDGQSPPYPAPVGTATATAAGVAGAGPAAPGRNPPRRTPNGPMPGDPESAAAEAGRHRPAGPGKSKGTTFARTLKDC
jgi:hypothetical protein